MTLKKVDKDSGFSLVELLAVIAVIAIAASIGVPAFSAWIPDYRLRNIVNELHSDMYLAKMKAIKENKEGDALCRGALK